MNTQSNLQPVTGDSSVQETAIRSYLAAHVRRVYYLPETVQSEIEFLNLVKVPIDMIQTIQRELKLEHQTR